MSKILLDYVFSISVITPTPAASTAFLKQACVVVKPKDGGVTTGEVSMLTAASQASAYAGAQAVAEIAQLFDAGMSRVYILPMDDLDLSDVMEARGSDFYTLLISSDFSEAEIEAGTQVLEPAVKAQVKVGDILWRAKEGGTDGNSLTIEYQDALEKNDGSATVVSVTDGAILIDIEDGVTDADTIVAAVLESEEASALVEGIVDVDDGAKPQNVTDGAQPLAGGLDAVTDNGDGLDIGPFKGVVGLSSDDDEFLEDQAKLENRCAFKGSDAKNLFHAFGKLLSNSLNWTNQQYISLPVAEGAETLGDANYLFDERISFAIKDDEFATRLGLFAAGGKAIIAPYVLKNLMIDLQSRSLQYISANQPQYTLTEATLLESDLQQEVIDRYVDRGWIESGSVAVTLQQQNFVASGEIQVPEPKALWRVFSELRHTI